MSFLTPRYLHTIGRLYHFELPDIAMILNLSFDAYSAWALDAPLPVSMVSLACARLGLPPRLFLTDEEYATLPPPTITLNGTPLPPKAAASAALAFDEIFADDPRDHRLDLSLQGAATTPLIRKKPPV